MTSDHMKIDVSVVIITWNMRSLLQPFLESLYRHSTGFVFEVILIDNNSQDGTADMVRSSFPNIRLSVNSKNRGVASARNQGIEMASGKYIAILDADMLLCENALCQLYLFMEQNQRVALVGCKLLDSDGNLTYSVKRYPTILEKIMGPFEHLGLLRNLEISKWHNMQDWNHEGTADVDYVTGACQFVRSEVLKVIGLYDEKIFYGPEDLDLCLRMWRQGFRVCYYPHAKIIHYEQRITRKKVFSVLSAKHLWGIVYLFAKYRGLLKRPGHPRDSLVNIES